MQDNVNYSYIHTIRDDEGNAHYIKDTEARDAITALESSKQDKIDASHKISTTYIDGLAAVATSNSYNDLDNKPNIPEGVEVDTSMSDSSTNPVQNKVVKAYIDGKLSAVFNFKGTKTSESAIKALTSASVGDVWINSADNSEWVCTEAISGTAKASAWEKLGFTIDLSGYELKANLKSFAYVDRGYGTTTPTGSVTINSYTPEGSLDMDAYTPEGNLSMNNFTPAGTISVDTGTANYTPAGSISMDSYTPEGSISINSYTPEGSVTVTPNTTTVNSITAVGTLPTFAAEVTNGVLEFTFNQGTLPTKGTDTTVATGIKSASFSGTGKAPTGSFSGTGKAPTGSFSGTGAYLKFTGTSAKPTGSFVGTAKAPTGDFEGTAKAPTGSFSGNVSQLDIYPQSGSGQPS